MISEPDSALAREARSLAESKLSAAFFAHSARTYHLGAAAGAAMAVPHDAELLFVAAVLHDIAMATPPVPEHSFEIVGAGIARALVQAHDPRGAQRVWDAIAVHTVPHLARAGAPESLLVHIASASDVFGLRLPLAADFTEALEMQYPRGEISREVDAYTTAESALHPFGQLAALRALGLRPR